MTGSRAELIARVADDAIALGDHDAVSYLLDVLLAGGTVEQRRALLAHALASATPEQLERCATAAAGEGAMLDAYRQEGN